MGVTNSEFPVFFSTVAKAAMLAKVQNSRVSAIMLINWRCRYSFGFPMACLVIDFYIKFRVSGSDNAKLVTLIRTHHTTRRGIQAKYSQPFVAQSEVTLTVLTPTSPWS